MTEGLGVAGRSGNSALLSIGPVPRAPSVMSNGKNSKLSRCDLIDDAVREPPKEISPTSTTKFRSEQGIRQHEVGSSFELGHKRETEFDVCLQCIERSGVMEFGEGRRCNDKLHFSAART